MGMMVYGFTVKMMAVVVVLLRCLWCWLITWLAEKWPTVIEILGVMWTVGWVNRLP
ncbi:hypothetical protein HanPI659440_Chr01g0020001 [Helianthus annuus]|nr:hypothetical protein HanPI659440_Chr01g0020001 [Helianthus annuus]